MMMNILIGLFLFVLVVIGLASCGEELTPQEQAKKDFEFDVKQTCQNSVTARLRSPSTAEFPYWSNWKMVGTYDDDEAVTWSHVDAENAFGGTVRQNFSCTFKKKDGESWKLTKVNI